MGNMLVLLQLDWPKEMNIAEMIMDIIRNRRSFSYTLFPTYIINIDMVEEFMHMWYPQGNDIQLEFIPPQTTIGQRRIGTRGADKKDVRDFDQVIRQQIAKSNDDLENLLIQFIMHEGINIVQ